MTQPSFNLMSLCGCLGLPKTVTWASWETVGVKSDRPIELVASVRIGSARKSRRGACARDEIAARNCPGKATLEALAVFTRPEEVRHAWAQKIASVRPEVDADIPGAA